MELHGDRCGYDDPAIVTGLGTINGKSYMFMGHQKGRNSKENIHRNFGMPTPHGYMFKILYLISKHFLSYKSFIEILPSSTMFTPPTNSKKESWENENATIFSLFQD